MNFLFFLPLRKKVLFSFENHVKIYMSSLLLQQKKKFGKNSNEKWKIYMSSLLLQQQKNILGRIPMKSEKFREILGLI